MESAVIAILLGVIAHDVIVTDCATSVPRGLLLLQRVR